MKPLVFLLHIFSSFLLSPLAEIHLPIQTKFNFPAPLPNFRKGGNGGFATGTINVGPLQLRQASHFKKITVVEQVKEEEVNEEEEAVSASSPESGVSFFKPHHIPRHFHKLGYMVHPNSRLLLAKEFIPGSLIPPLGYSIVGNLTSLNSTLHLWTPLPPLGYKAMGHVITSTPSKPSLQEIRCVLSNLTQPCILYAPPLLSTPHISIFSLDPSDGVPLGTFTAVQNNNPSPQASLSCLKAHPLTSASPDLQNLKSLIKSYSPVFHFHPSEEYLPSSVDWFFSNGAMLYTRTDPNNPSAISPSGENLPTSTAADNTHWIDLPKNRTAREIVKKGRLDSAEAYVNMKKQMLGGTATDIVFWLFYPFNGPAALRFKKVYTFKLETVGEHVGDWEHVTLRISNFNGRLERVFFSQHGRGEWVEASELEFERMTNKPVVYSTLHGHAAVGREGEFFVGGGLVRVWSEGRGGGEVMDSGERARVVGGMPAEVADTPQWVDYMGRWGPNHTYGVGREIERVVAKVVQKWLRKKAMAELPREVVMETGPFGPKAKDNWSGDEVC